MTKRANLQLIDKAFFAIERALESDRDFDTFFRQVMSEEKDHRRFVTGTNGLSTPQAARLFVVRVITEQFLSSKAPATEDIFTFRLSKFQAFALVARYRGRVVAALTPFDLNELLALDYAELNAA